MADCFTQETFDPAVRNIPAAKLERCRSPESSRQLDERNTRTSTTNGLAGLTEASSSCCLERTAKVPRRSEGQDEPTSCREEDAGPAPSMAGSSRPMWRGIPRRHHGPPKSEYPSNGSSCGAASIRRYPHNGPGEEDASIYKGAVNVTRKIVHIRSRIPGARGKLLLVTHETPAGEGAPVEGSASGPPNDTGTALMHSDTSLSASTDDLNIEEEEIYTEGCATDTDTEDTEFYSMRHYTKSGDYTDYDDTDTEDTDFFSNRHYVKRDAYDDDASTDSEDAQAESGDVAAESDNVPTGNDDVPAKIDDVPAETGDVPEGEAPAESDNAKTGSGADTDDEVEDVQTIRKREFCIGKLERVLIRFNLPTGLDRLLLPMVNTFTSYVSFGFQPKASACDGVDAYYTIQRNGQPVLFMYCFKRVDDPVPLLDIPLDDAVLVLNTYTEYGPSLYISTRIGVFEFQTSSTGPCNYEFWGFRLREFGVKCCSPHAYFVPTGDTLVGAGSFAQVYPAYHKPTGKHLAIKMIPKDKMGNLPWNQSSAVCIEMEVLRRLRHSSVVTYYTSFHDDDFYYLVLEQLAGGSMYDWIQEHHQYTEDQAREAMRRLLTALIAMESQRVVHRDIKLENVMLENRNDPCSVKLIDFGLSAFLNTPRMNMQCGSPGFVAPEIINRQPYGCRVDMFSVGVLLYSILSGRMPFNGATNSASQTLFKNKHCDVKFDPDVWSHLSREAYDLVNRLIVRDPAKRYSPQQALNHPWMTAGSSACKESAYVPRLSRTARRLLYEQHKAERSQQPRYHPMRKPYVPQKRTDDDPTEPARRAAREEAARAQAMTETTTATTYSTAETTTAATYSTGEPGGDVLHSTRDTVEAAALSTTETTTASTDSAEESPISRVDDIFLPKLGSVAQEEVLGHGGFHLEASYRMTSKLHYEQWHLRPWFAAQRFAWMKRFAERQNEMPTKGERTGAKGTKKADDNRTHEGDWEKPMYAAA